MVFLAVWLALLGYTFIYMGISGFSKHPVSLWDALGLSSAPAAQPPSSSTVAPPGTPVTPVPDKPPPTPRNPTPSGPGPVSL